MPEDVPIAPQPNETPSNSMNPAHPPPARERHHRGRWRRFRHREDRNSELLPESLNLQELKGLSLEEMQNRLEEMQIVFKSKERNEILQEALRFNAEKQGFHVAEGILDISRGGFGFLRSSEFNYQPQLTDAYVSQQLIRQFSLQVGDLVTGIARAPRNRERYHTLLHVDLIWNELPDKIRDRKPYDELTPLYPEKRLVLETTRDVISTRALDLLAPLGRGQRCLLIAPPRAGKTVLMQQIAEGIQKNDPDVDVLVLLLDERPEEVYTMRQAIKGEVISSTFDETTERHLRIADLIIEKAHRMVENGRHVVLFLDSLTRLARACNNNAPSRGKLMSGGIESGALAKPRKFFSSARNIEGGGSLTIVATVLVETGSRMDDLIFEEFKGTGNMEVHLSRDLQERRIYPAIHIEKSGTRREDLLYHPDELVRIQALRKQLAEVPPLEAMEKLIEQLRATNSNAELLMRLKLE